MKRPSEKEREALERMTSCDLIRSLLTIAYDEDTPPQLRWKAVQAIGSADLEERFRKYLEELMKAK